MNAGIEVTDQYAINEGMFIDINGTRQWISIRGCNRTNPVLLIINGPGYALSPMTPFFAPWGKNFTLVQWDQPGAGATYAANDNHSMDTLTIDRITQDGLAVSKFLLQHLHIRKIAILGLSAGSIIGLMMAHREPSLFSAYIGSGQVVDWAKQDTLSYKILLEQAYSSQNQQMIAELKQIGPPPYQSVESDAIKSKYAGAMTTAETAPFADPSLMQAIQSPEPDAPWVARGVTLTDARTLSLQSYSKMRSEIVSFDAYRLATTFALPVFFIQGGNDMFTVTSEVQDYMDAIDAPAKRIILLENGGHSCFLMRDDFLSMLNLYIRPVIENRVNI